MADTVGEGDLEGGSAMAEARALLVQLEELEPRLQGGGEVELTLLERSTELVEEVGRLLERLGRPGG